MKDLNRTLSKMVVPDDTRMHCKKPIQQEEGKRGSEDVSSGWKTLTEVNCLLYMKQGSTKKVIFLMHE